MIDRDALVQQIYEAAVFSEQGPDVLERLGQAARAPGVVLLTRRSDAWTGFSIAKPLEEAFSTYLTSSVPTQSDTTRRGHIGSNSAYAFAYQRSLGGAVTVYAAGSRSPVSVQHVGELP
jgi:hypothetical protein